jgi:membrane-bound lytic murein transglycosylase A
MMARITSIFPIRTDAFARGALCAAAIFLASCAGTPGKDAPQALSLKPAQFSDLPGWGADDLRPFVQAYANSCARILKAPPDKTFGALKEAGTYLKWQGVCLDMKALDAANTAAIQSFVERHFTPYAVLADGEAQGLFTGYYEASLRGSRSKSAAYSIPLYARPDDLVMVDLGEFRDELKGQRIAGRVREGNLKPYETRAQIVAGRWPHNDKVLVWVDNAVDAFFVQIQGSGIVELAEGGTMRIGYAGQNGHIYTAIGRELIKRGALSKENVSMQAIREWLGAHPDQAEEIMSTNESYVFFKALESGPMGGENVTLTPERSLAVDRSLLAYGLPLWLETEQPALRRLMVAQDTGGAIRGPVRGDVFWGYGPRAEAMAGPMKSPGRYWALLPR